jgi:hypothetical protein
VKKKLMLALAVASLALAGRSDAGENLKLNPKLDYSSDSQDGPLITGDRMDEGAAAGKPNYVLIVGEG